MNGPNISSPSDSIDFERVLQTVDYATYVTTPDGELIYVNPAFERLTGYADDEIIGETPAILNSGAHSDEYYADLWQTVTAGETWTEEIVNCRKNGTHYTAHQTISPVVVDGEIERFVATQRDVTEQKAREQRLRQYERAIEGTHDLIAAVDTQYQYLFANERYRTFHDIDQRELAGATLEDTLDPEMFEQVEPHVEQALTGDVVSYRMTRSTPEDDDEVFDIRYYPLRDGDDTIQGVVAAMRDVTDLVEQTRQLSRNRDLLARTEERGGVGGWEYDTDTETLSWTDGVRKLHDVPESYDPTVEEAFGFHHREDHDKVEQAIQNCLEEGVEYDIRTRLITSDGVTRWLRTTGERIQRDGKTVLQGTVVDITEQVHREKRLMVLNRVLRHNLRNDLNTVIGYAELLETEFSEIAEVANPTDVRSAIETLDRLSQVDDIPEDHQSALGDIEATLDELSSVPTKDALEAVELIRETSESLVDIAEKAREFEQHADEDQILEAVAVGPLLEDVAATYRDEFPDAEVTVVGAEASVRGNTGAIRRILDELVENALKHSTRQDPASTVVLRVQATSAQTATIRVEDTGPGIPEIEQKTIERGEETALMHGSGIGLWLVNWLVTRFGGTVTIEESEPRGTVVSVELPTVD